MANNTDNSKKLNLRQIKRRIMGSPHSAIVTAVACDVMPVMAVDCLIDYASTSTTTSSKHLTKVYDFQKADKLVFSGRLKTITTTKDVQHKAKPFVPKPVLKHESIPWSFIGTFIFTAGCFYSYYLSIHQYNRYPSWYQIPMISFCGCYPEEQPVWRATFIFAAIGQMMAQWTITNTALYRYFLVHSPLWIQNGSRYLLALHAFASLLVGVFPLNPIQCEESVSMIGTSIENHSMDTTAIPHYISALFAGGPGVIGVILGVFAHYYALQNTVGVFESTPLKKIFIFKVLCASLMCLGLVAICVIAPIMVWWEGHVTRNMANFISLAEWVLCIPMGLCDGCYSIENYYVVESLRKRGKRYPPKECRMKTA